MNEKQASKKVVRGFRWRYCLALLMIALLSSFSFSLIYRVLELQLSDGATINMAGRQRMLSQRIAFLSQIYLEASPEFTVSHSTSESLQEAAEELFHSHQILTQLSIRPLSKTLERLYFEGGEQSVDHRVRYYVDNVQLLLSVNSFSGLSNVNLLVFEREFVDGLLEDLNNIVNQYEEEAYSRSQDLLYMEWGIWLFTLMALLTEAIIIFRPMEFALKSSFRELFRQKDNALMLKFEAESATLAKSQFLANISHEIRTPMNGLLGMLNIMLAKPLPEDQKQRAEIARDSAESLMGLISDVLDFTDMESNALSIESNPFSVHSLISAVVEANVKKAEEKGLEFIVDTAELDEKVLLGDLFRLQQILDHLIDNAIKFTKKGHVIVTLTVDDSSFGQPKLIGVVRDSGIGIHSSKQNILFNVFTQIDDSHSREYGGAGLGLAIVKRLCYAMEGEISVSSEVGKGSTFSFTIPVQLSREHSEPLPVQDIETLTVLVVDSNQYHREVICRQLEHWGVTVQTSSDGQSALDVCLNLVGESQSIPFDVVIINENLPGISGVELGSIFMTDVKLNRMKSILMVGATSTLENKYIRLNGFFAYFEKPATSYRLFSALYSVVSPELQWGTDAFSVLSRHVYLLQAHSDSIAKEMAEKPVVLVVEDNQLNQEIICQYLHSLECYTEVASSGKEALEKISRRMADPYTFILMDYQMPVLDGLEAAEYIRQGMAGDYAKGTPIVIMVSSAMKGKRGTFIDAGIDDVITKPVNKHSLSKIVARWKGGDPHFDLLQESQVVSDKEYSNSQE
nr:response regulator [Marinibactrum halimedae]